MQSVIGIILGGGQGARLYPLTKFSAVSCHRLLYFAKCDECYNGFVLALYIFLHVRDLSIL